MQNICPRITLPVFSIKLFVCSNLRGKRHCEVYFVSHKVLAQLTLAHGTNRTASKTQPHGVLLVLFCFQSSLNQTCTGEAQWLPLLVYVFVVLCVRAFNCARRCDETEMWWNKVLLTFGTQSVSLSKNLTCQFLVLRVNITLLKLSLILRYRSIASILLFFKIQHWYNIYPFIIKACSVYFWKTPRDPHVRFPQIPTQRTTWHVLCTSLNQERTDRFGSWPWLFFLLYKKAH